MRSVAAIVLSILCGVTLVSCASVMPLDGGSIEDHETTLSRCGVGNYLFHDAALRCPPPNP